MITIPTLPLSKESQEAVSFAKFFHSDGGFFAIYEQQVARLGHIASKPGGKTKAYEATEHLYFSFFNERRYRDIEVFWRALARHLRRAKEKR